MKTVRFVRYIKNESMTGDNQYMPDQIAVVSDARAKLLVETGHAEYVPAPKKKKKMTMEEYEAMDYGEVVP